MCSYEAVQKGSCPFKDDCRFGHERDKAERQAMRKSRTNPAEMKEHRARVAAAKEKRGAKLAHAAPEEDKEPNEGRAALLASAPADMLADGNFE